jgi:hypothetical protein
VKPQAAEEKTAQLILARRLGIQSGNIAGKREAIADFEKLRYRGTSTDKYLGHGDSIIFESGLASFCSGEMQTRRCRVF